MADSPHNQRPPSGWGFVICSGIVLALLALPVFWRLLISGAFPPAWYERRTQRQKINERVQAAGGWEALRRDCITLAKTNENEIFRWARWVTNSPILPPAILALQPQEVYYVSSKFHTGVPDESQIPIVVIKMFGSHSTGGHSTPFFGLEVVASPSRYDYAPNAGRVYGQWHTGYRKVSDGVYEVF